jgi:hypothetical protein
MRVSLCYEHSSPAERNKGEREREREREKGEKQANGTWEKHTVY